MFISQETETTNDYLLAPDEFGLQQLTSQIGSAQPRIDWLEGHVGSADVKRVSLVDQSYRDYTATLRELVAAAGKGGSAAVADHAEQATTMARAMRKLLNSDLAFQRSRLRHLGVAFHAPGPNVDDAGPVVNACTVGVSDAER